MSRQERLNERAQEWIVANPAGYGWLVERAKAHSEAGKKFAIKKLIEQLRWDTEQGTRPEAGGSDFAIPNALTRYIGHAIMRAHPETEQYMTTRLPKGEQVEAHASTRATIEQAAAMTAWAREALTGLPQKLVWCVNLRKELGEPDDGDGYSDGRWEALLERLKAMVAGMKDEPNSVTPLGLIVVCMVGSRVGGSPQPVAVELSIPAKVDAGKLMAKNPPKGEWRVMGEGEFKDATKGISTPRSYFTDGIPF
jgi:hypothetical protein